MIILIITMVLVCGAIAKRLLNDSKVREDKMFNQLDKFGESLDSFNTTLRKIDQRLETVEKKIEE